MIEYTLLGTLLVSEPLIQPKNMVNFGKTFILEPGPR